MIEIVHDDGRCIKGTPDAVVIAEREAAEYNPVTIANEIPWCLRAMSQATVPWVAGFGSFVLPTLEGETRC